MYIYRGTNSPTVSGIYINRDMVSRAIGCHSGTTPWHSVVCALSLAYPSTSKVIGWPIRLSRCFIYCLQVYHN